MLGYSLCFSQASSNYLTKGFPVPLWSCVCKPLMKKMYFLLKHVWLPAAEVFQCLQCAAYIVGCDGQCPGFTLLVKSTHEYIELTWSHYNTHNFSILWHRLTVTPSVCYGADLILLEWPLVPYLFPVLYIHTPAVTHYDSDHLNHSMGPFSSKSQDVKPGRCRTQR